jgi:hypothetical protein
MHMFVLYQCYFISTSNLIHLVYLVVVDSTKFTCEAPSWNSRLWNMLNTLIYFLSLFFQSFNKLVCVLGIHSI